MPAWCSSRTSSPASRSGPISAPPPRRNACAPAASTTTSTMSATPRAITLFRDARQFLVRRLFQGTHAIELAWNLITKEFGLPKDKLTGHGLYRRRRGLQLWKKIAACPTRIIRIAGSDNFWAMGDTGPCGRARKSSTTTATRLGRPAGLAGEDGDRFIEIWNLVFMQFEQLTRHAPPCRKPSIDTGMGLERIAAVLQGARQLRHRPVRALIRADSELTGADPTARRRPRTA
jgi:alanyl-tRNA synthetase